MLSPRTRPRRPPSPARASAVASPRAFRSIVIVRVRVRVRVIVIFTHKHRSKQGDPNPKDNSMLRTYTSTYKGFHATVAALFCIEEFLLGLGL